MLTFAPHQIDFYKTGHHLQYPEGTEYVYSNLTARSGNHSNVPLSKGVIFVGMQLFLQEYLIDSWNRSFFDKPKFQVINKYRRRITDGLGVDVDVAHLEALHDLGYLPLQIKALPEGSFVPYKVPLLTIRNTLPDFYWLPNFLETVLSSELWLPITSATTYYDYLKRFYEYALLTGSDLSFVPFQGHDFSFRGMACKEAAAKSGFAALACGGLGTDSVSAIDIAEDYYNAADFEFIGGSVFATEHSVMCAGSKEGELSTFRRLITKVHPSGVVSIVSDTWDFWKVVDDFLPFLKDDILARDGKVVIRPDSGDPVDIICGTVLSDKDTLNTRSSQEKGLIERLWEIFGGTVNAKGYKVLNPKIGAIYGDSITIERQKEILWKLQTKGFASSNIVLGIGSYTFQYVTRDTHGLAMKATSVVVNGERRDIFKEPKTDNGTKKSAKGLLMVANEGGKYRLIDGVSLEQEERGCLETVFLDGKLTKQTSLSEIRERVFNNIKEELGRNHF